MRTPNLVVLLAFLIFLASNAAAQSLEDLKLWFGSEAETIMQDPAVAQLGTYSASVKNVQLENCYLSWTAHDGAIVRVRLQSIDTGHLRVQRSQLLSGRPIVLLEMETRADGTPMTSENGLAFTEMNKATVLVRDWNAGQQLLNRMQRAVALCQGMDKKP